MEAPNGFPPVFTPPQIHAKFFGINFSIGCHDGDRVVVLSTFLLSAMMAIVW
jgi:hypothetical protein